MQKIESEMDAILAFLDADTYDDKLVILGLIEEYKSDHLVDTLAASMDTVIPDGNIDNRYEELRSHVRMQKRFEVRR